MADIGVAIVAHLKTKTAVTDLIGSGADMRINAGYLPQCETLPAVVYHEITGTSYEHLVQGAGTVQDRYQIDCYADTAIAAVELREQIRLAMQTFNHAIWGGIYIHGCNSDTKHSGTDEPEDGSDAWRYRYSQDYLITYAETAAAP